MAALIIPSSQPTPYELEARVVQSITPRFMQSVALARGDGSYAPEAIERLNDRKQTAINRKNELRDEKESFKESYADFFRATVAKENQAVDYANGFQWEERQKKEIREAGLVPHVSNYFKRWVKTKTGEYKGAEREFQYEHNDPSQKLEADMWTQFARVTCRQNRWSSKSGDLMDDAALRGRCVASVGLDPKDPSGRMLMKRWRPAEFLYDHDGWEDGTGEGGKYLLRAYYRDVEDLIFEFPLWENELRKGKVGKARGRDILDFTLPTPKVHPTNQRDEVTTGGTSKRDFFTKRAVWCEEFQRKSGETVYTVRDGVWHLDFDFDNVEQAVYFYKEMRQVYEALANMEGAEFVDMTVAPRRATRTVLDVEYWAGDLLLDVATRKQDDFTYRFCHPEFQDGAWRGHFDDDLPHQTLMNYHMVYMSMILAGGNGKWFYDVDMLPKGMSQEQFETNLRRPTKALGVKRPTNAKDRPLNDFLHYEGPGERSHLPQFFLQFAQQMQQHNNGGLQEIGVSSPGMSGKLGQQLHVAAQAGDVQLFKRVEELEVMIGTDLITTAQHLAPQAILECVDPRERASYIPVLNNGIQSVRDGQFMVQVHEVMGGPSKRALELEQLKEFAINAPETTEDIMPEVIELSSMSKARQDRISARTQARQARQAQEIENEQRRLDFAESEKWRLANVDRQIKIGELEVKKMPPIKTSLVGKLTDPGPGFVATAVEASGVPADPVVLMEDQSLQRKLNQEERDMIQKRQNELTPEWQKKAVSPSKAGAGHQGKRQGGPSAKDTNARKRKVVKK